MNILKAIKSRFTMIKQKPLFYDKVNGKTVNQYKDCYNKKWMAQSRLGFRTIIKNQTN